MIPIYTAGVDYEAVSRQLTFAPSSQEIMSLLFTIAIIDDATITRSVRQFEVHLNTTQPGVFFGSDNQTATVNIHDNDGNMLVVLPLNDTHAHTQ